MHPIYGSVAALAVGVIFYVYRAYAQMQVRRQRLLRERVTYLLWVAAGQAEDNHEVLAVD